MFRSSRQRRVQLQGSAPSLVAAGTKLGQLSKLRAIPFQAELQRSLPKIGRAPPRSIEAHNTGVAQAQIATKRLPLQPHAPGIFRVLPESEISIGQGVGFFLLPD